MVPLIPLLHYLFTTPVDVRTQQHRRGLIILLVSPLLLLLLSPLLIVEYLVIRPVQWVRRARNERRDAQATRRRTAAGRVALMDRWGPREVGTEEHGRIGEFRMHELPLLPAMLVLDELNILEVLSFSLTSPECQEMTRRFFGKITDKTIEVHVDDTLETVLRLKGFLRNPEHWVRVHIRCLEKSAEMSRTRMYTTNRDDRSGASYVGHFDVYYEEHTGDGMVEWLDHLTYILGCHVTSILVTIGAPQCEDETHRFLAGHFGARQKVDLVRIEEDQRRFPARRVSEKTASLILENCDRIDQLHFRTRVTRGFVCPRGMRPPRVLELCNADWFTMRHLLEMGDDVECVRICTYHRPFSHRHLRAIVEHWQRGRLPNLKKFDIEMGEYHHFEPPAEHVDCPEEEQEEEGEDVPRPSEKCCEVQRVVDDDDQSIIIATIKWEIGFHFEVWL